MHTRYQILLSIAGTFTLDLVPWNAGPLDGPLQSVSSLFTLAPLESKIVYSDKVAVLLAAANILPKNAMVRCPQLSLQVILLRHVQDVKTN